MLSSINYHITQLNRFHCVLVQNKLQSTPPSFVLGKQIIPAVDKSKYLGIIVSEINCDADLKRQIRKYCASTNILLRKFSYCSPDIKCCMFKYYCATMYCSSMWFDSTVISMKKLKVAYNNGIRRLLNLPKYNSASEVFVNLNILSFGQQLRKSVFSFRKRIINLEYSLVHGIVNSAAPSVSKIWVLWSDILKTY